MAPTFDTLPTELSLQILKKVPDTKTLQSLVHASPTYHRVYLMDREEIFTSVTLRELAEHGITFPDDVSTIILFFPADLDETLTDTIYPKDIETLYRQIRAHTPIKLDIDACLRLRDVDRTMDIQDKYLFVWAAGRLRNHYGEHGVTVHLDPWPKITMIER